MLGVGSGGSGALTGGSTTEGSARDDSAEEAGGPRPASPSGWCWSVKGAEDRIAWLLGTGMGGPAFSTGGSAVEGSTRGDPAGPVGGACPSPPNSWCRALKGAED